MVRPASLRGEDRLVCEATRRTGEKGIDAGMVQGRLLGRRTTTE
ncbi:hypothetical protein AB0L56_01115 [Streptomyces sp. NPDC052079]